jgi:cobyrinic acid a,c-diamide synthase
VPAVFKKGPDYIDAGWLSMAAGVPCYNLDPFLVGEKNILPSFVTHQAAADISIIEGNRGIFDGMDLKGSQSTARLVSILQAPVILILDATKMTRTTAALVMGVQKFDKELKLGGVVLNCIAGRRHESVCRQAIEHYTGVPVLGAIRRIPESQLYERHMGLVPYQEHPMLERAIDSAKDLVRDCVDMEQVLKVACSAPALKSPPELKRKEKGAAYLKIGVLRDSAFQFYYPENLEALKSRGAELVSISPVQDKELPELDALYIGGGFPETHAVTLSRNKLFLSELKDRIEKGLPVYAECGGLMYLGEALVLQGKKYPMTGIFPFEFELEEKPVAHGYSIARVGKKNPFYQEGKILKGHEFHYSRPVRTGPGKNVIKTLTMERGTGIEEGKDGLVYKKVFATYTHTHVLGTPEWADGLLRAAMDFKDIRNM